MDNRKEYRVVYSYRGYVIEAGSNGWLPDKETAEKVRRKQQKRTLFKDDILYLEERVAQREYIPCRVYGGRKVLNEDYFRTDAAEPGDLVEEKLVDCFINELPPASMSSSCSQAGEPYSIRIDENGRERNTYLTFKKIAPGVWEFCGDCFRGKNIMTGTVPSYI